MIENNYRECIERASEVVRAAPWGDLAFYAPWLAQTHYYVSHSTHLLAAAASRMGSRHETLFRRFIAHIAEEQGHERLVAKDLEALGRVLSEFAEWPLTTAFYETQYSMIARRSPCVLLGYILFLEGLAAGVGPFVHEQLLGAFGPKAVSFIRVHAEDDASHLEKAFALLDGLAADEIEEISANVSLTCDLYCRLIRALAEAAAA